jgi:hypothetical protein
VVYSELKEGSPLFAEAKKKRDELVDKIANYDEIVG